jgi:2-oxo-4-hydroxy-4-carboxy-5-ureidoimidazoline decarboxylase
MRDASAVTRADPDAVTVGLRDLNTLPEADALAALREISGSTRWAQLMAGGRPFAAVAQLMAAAQDAFDRLEDSDWLESFAAHSPLGAPREGDGRGTREQSGLAGASEAQRAELREGNERYRARFGYGFLIRARGRQIDEVLAELRRRLENSVEAELAVAAAQQREITRLRLGELVGGR